MKFEVICDETNNSKEDVEANRLNAAIVVEPTGYVIKFSTNEPEGVVKDRIEEFRKQWHAKFRGRPQTVEAP